MSTIYGRLFLVSAVYLNVFRPVLFIVDFFWQLLLTFFCRVMLVNVFPAGIVYRLVYFFFCWDFSCQWLPPPPALACCVMTIFALCPLSILGSQFCWTLWIFLLSDNYHVLLIIFCFLTTLVPLEHLFSFWELSCPLPSFALRQLVPFVHFNKLDSCDTYVPPWGKFLCNALYMYMFLNCGNWNARGLYCINVYHFPLRYLKGRNILKIDGHLDREKAMSGEYLLALLLFTLSALATYLLTCLLSLSRDLMLMTFVTSLFWGGMLQIWFDYIE